MIQKACFAKSKCNIGTKRYALESQNAIFEQKSMLWKVKMQYFIQKVFFGKSNAIIEQESMLCEVKNAISEHKSMLWKVKMQDFNKKHALEGQEAIF